MKKIVIFSALFVSMFGDAGAVVSRSQTARSAARPVVNSRMPSNEVAPAKVATRGRAATVAKMPTVAARAATTQKVIGTGTKVASATKNVVVSEECQQKYDGCMDSFCMLDNDTGGRCLCSDKNAEFDAILAEIEKLDQQSYQMATFGVENIEMGDDADAVIAKANAVAQSVLSQGEEKKARRTLDLSMWDTSVDFDDDEDIFGASAVSPIDGKDGDALHRAAAELCVAQIPECQSEIQMLQMMYAQRIKSDCAAYENSLKQQKNSSAQKLAAAERALREAALDQYRAANKYDLGQCTVEFKKCMQTTGGCGDDFSGCASMVAMDATNTRQSTSRQAKNYQIKGVATNIEISASTYDALMAKKPLCESITKSCVNVAGQVWDTFLREVAPQVKNAELIAEDKAHQDCIGNISSCFQKACKDTMDPKDPDGSYDMCLSRPGTMLNLCRVPLNACGIDASSEAAAEKSDVWDFVVARLASMRVDSCTTEVKECLQSEDRCGKDYSQCVGLDTDTIIRMCPYEKLTGCQKIYGEEEIRGDAVYDELATMVQGIMLNIDNSILAECQAAADEAMIRVCGATEDCNGLAVDDNIGARSLEYKLCEYKDDAFQSNCRNDVTQIQDSELGRGGTERKAFAGKFEGEIPWDAISFIDENGNLTGKPVLNLPEGSAPLSAKVQNELNVLYGNINAAIAAIESDQKVQYCMTGREVQAMRRANAETGEQESTRIGSKSGADAARFPQLTSQMRSIIATSALKIAKDNYHKKYDELQKQLAQDYVTLGERMAEIDGLNKLDARREMARQACVNLANGSVLATSKGKNNVPTSPIGLDLIGSKQRNDWNYKETITSTFEWETLNCHRCVRTQNCTKPKRKWCKRWGEEEETCNDIQF